jgi:hypothetical protein
LPKLSIFVSSKTDELREERKRIKSVFSSELFDVFVFEQAGARTEAAEKVYKYEVLNCDIYVGIFKEKYSWATEEEYKLASQSRKVIHVYVADSEKRDSKLDRLLTKKGSALAFMLNATVIPEIHAGSFNQTLKY